MPMSHFSRHGGLHTVGLHSHVQLRSNTMHTVIRAYSFGDFLVDWEDAVTVWWCCMLVITTKRHTKLTWFVVSLFNPSADFYFFYFSKEIQDQCVLKYPGVWCSKCTTNDFEARTAFGKIVLFEILLLYFLNCYILVTFLEINPKNYILNKIFHLMNVLWSQDCWDLVATKHYDRRTLERKQF